MGILKQLTLLMLTIVLSCAGWAQEETPPVVDSGTTAADDADGSADTEDADVEEDSEEEEAVDDMDDGVLDEAFEDESLDEQTYEDDEDDFIPTEEIPADEPIPFPSNI